MNKILLWTGALIVGASLGWMGWTWLDDVMNVVATVYVRLFQLLAVPTIVLAVVTTLVSMGGREDTGRLFRRTLTYTLLTTLAAALVGAVLYVAVDPVAPTSVHRETSLLSETSVSSASGEEGASYASHLLSVVPNNIVRPFLEGNVLSLLLVAFAVGIALARMADTEQKRTVVNLLQGLQDVLFVLIGWLIWTLPLGIVAFAAQLSAQLQGGVVAESLGRYVLVILGGNALQFFVVLPLFLLARGLNPLHVLSRMMPAVLMALFTKSSAATLPVTMQTAEQRLGVSSRVARFVLPICTTINMNGCAAFILVTSLFLLQSSGTPITLPTVLLWVVISVFSAVGNAGVPMGCYFLTLSLVSGTGTSVALMGLILPIYTIIDMVETAENVWSDSCVCAMTDHDLRR